MAVIVNLEEERGRSRKPSLDELQRLVNDDLRVVNELIVKHMHSPVPLIPQLAGHLVAAGGKRLRPLLTLASARMCGYRGGRHHALAACVEFIHTATLLHDDVVDESDLRRGLATANALWGNKASVLVGDFLFSRAFELMVEDGSLRVLDDPLRRLGGDRRGRGAAARHHQRHRYLRARLSRRHPLPRPRPSSPPPAASAPSSPSARRSRRRPSTAYGLNLGIAFQLVDDMLDYSAKQAELGKTVGDDFREGKVTLPVVLAFRRGDEAERGFWRRCIEQVDQRTRICATPSPYWNATGRCATPWPGPVTTAPSPATPWASSPTGRKSAPCSTSSIFASSARIRACRRLPRAGGWRYNPRPAIGV